MAILTGASILLIIGLIDDKMGMMPNMKLLGQFLAAMIAIKAGVRVEFIHQYYLDVIFTYLWFIGITNSLNLLDNMNGLSAGIATISAIWFGVITYMSGNVLVSALSFALAGSTLGFLRHNFPKASIFMGDTGSLIIGYLLACVSILSSWKTDLWTTSLLAPLLILGYPIFDTMLVTVMRIMEGRSVFEGGKDHSSHRLALLGLKRFGAVLVIYAVCAFLGVVALIVTRVPWEKGIMLGLAAFFAMTVLGVRLALVNTARFGHRKNAD
jgi:UDP-GlcNAc:undecaprenyl-phosphate GlcNAc-1-phosphate transferase